MRRGEKYPCTDTFKYYNANPKGRFTGDCRIRAISAATGEDYNKIVMAFAFLQCETGYDQCVGDGIDILMAKLGWVKMKQPRKANGTKYTGKQWCELLSRKYPNGEIGNIMCNIGGHHEVAILPRRINGKLYYKVHDTWNSTGGCIGNYWIKEGVAV